MEEFHMIWLLLFCLALVIALPVLAEKRRTQIGPDERQSAPGSFATLSQGVTHYQWIGPVRGPVAVCVHGLTTPSFVWTGIAQGLAKLGFRVLVYDLYGRGYSDRPGGPQNRIFFLRQLEDLLDDQQVKGDFTLLGYSMGGAISLANTAAHPDRVRKLILLASAGTGISAGGLANFVIRTPVIGDWMMLASFPRTHRQATERERGLTGSTSGIVDLQQAELKTRGFIPGVLASLRGLLSEDLKPAMKTIHQAGIPVLAIWASEDEVISPAAVGILSEHCRSVQHETVDGAGHGLPYTHTAEVLQVIRRDIERTTI
jgi:pimeloyl-ACP methyl ester carboxylesterase